MKQGEVKMIENLIRESSLRLLNILSENSTEIHEIISNQDFIEIIEESIEVLTDETLKNFDDYISSLGDDEDE